MRSEFLCFEVQLVSVANGRVSAEVCRCGSSAACVEEEDVCGRGRAKRAADIMQIVLANRCAPSNSLPAAKKGIFA